MSDFVHTDAARAAGASETADAAESYPYRMKDLCELTGLSRQAIHFYVQQGLVPPGHKTSRNMAFYGDEHLQRLQLVQKLQNEHFLPLKAIRALLEGEIGEFEPEQRELLRDIKSHLPRDLLKRHDRSETVPLAPLAERCGVRMDEVRSMAELGLVTILEVDGELRVASDDTWAVEHWGEIRALGMREELGFEVGDLAVYEQAISALFEREREIMIPRLSKFDPEQAAEMLSKALPLVHAMLARYHTALVRNFFAAME